MSITLVKHLLPRKFTAFANHILISGKTGSGKSNTAEWLLTQVVGKHKCVDVYDDGRGENFTYDKPCSDKKFIERMRVLSGGKYGSKAFPLEIIMFAGPKIDLLKKIKLPTNVRIMSLKKDGISISDLKFLLATTDPQKNVLDYLQIECPNYTMQELYDRLKIDEPHHPLYLKGLGNAKYGILFNLTKWLNSPLFDNDLYETIDFKKIALNKDIITSFSTFLQEDDDVKALIYGLILKQLFIVRRNGEIPHPITIYVREVSNMVGDHKISSAFKFAEYYILRILREGRDYKLNLLSCSQRPIDIGTMRRLFSIHVVMKQDLQDAIKLLEIQEIDKTTLCKIPHLGRGEALVCTGTDYFYPVFFPPTQHHHKVEGESLIEQLGQKINKKVVGR